MARSKPQDMVVNEDETLDGVIVGLERTYGVEIHVIETSGPSGWPVVVLTGQRHQVLNALRGAWGLVDIGDPNDAALAELELDEGGDR